MVCWANFTSSLPITGESEMVSYDLRLLPVPFRHHVFLQLIALLRICLLLFYFIYFQRQGSSLQAKLASLRQSSCISHLSVGMLGVCHTTQPLFYLKNVRSIKNNSFGFMIYLSHISPHWLLAMLLCLHELCAFSYG